MSLQDDRLQDWRSWKSGDTRALNRLMGSLGGLIQPKVEELSNASQLPRSAIEAEVKLRTVEALNRYDPDRGTQISSWVTSALPKANEYAFSHAAVARIPEERRMKVRSYKAALHDLQVRKGRDPSIHELQDELMWPEKDVRNIQRELRTEMSAERQVFNPMNPSLDRDLRHVTDWLQHDLTPEEHMIYEKITGADGPPMSTRQVAQAIGKTEREVRTIRERIASKIVDRVDLSVH